MSLFLILAPFGVLSFAMLVTMPAVGLFAGAAVAFALVLRDIVAHRGIKMLTAGTALVFGMVGLYVVFIDKSVSNTTVRLVIDGSILSIALLSFALRTPFTIQYSRDMVDAETRVMPRFIRTNYILTGVWSLAFILMTAVDAAAIYIPNLPVWGLIALPIAARNGAAYFTTWYRNRIRAAIAAESADMRRDAVAT
jgi:hypothetical protein